MSFFLDFKKMGGLSCALACLSGISFAGSFDTQDSQYLDFSLGYGASGIELDEERADIINHDIKNRILSLGYGQNLNNDIKIEINLLYDGTNQKNFYYKTGKSDTVNKISETSYQAMLNGYYPLHMHHEHSLYVMGGMGVSINKVKSSKIRNKTPFLVKKYSEARDSQTRFAYHTGVTYFYDISSNVSVHLDYRLSHNGSSKYNIYGPEDQEYFFVRTKMNNSFLFGASYKF